MIKHPTKKNYVHYFIITKELIFNYLIQKQKILSEFPNKKQHFISLHTKAA